MTRDEWLASAGQAAADDELLPLLGRTPLKMALSDCGVVGVSGDDAVSFLHAQFCGDCRGLGPGQTMLTGWCTPKGRVLYLPRLIAGAHGMYALLPADQVAAFVQRLRMFVLRAKVTVEDLGASHGATLLCTPGAGTLRLAYVSEADSTNASSADATRHWLVAPYATLAAAWRAVAARVASDNLAHLAAIRAGEVALATALSDHFLPQELGLDQGGGLSFDKGCYPGQEIVARVKFRGEVKRRPRRLGSASAPAAPGTRLLDAAGAAVGTLLLAASVGAARSELLAVVDVDTQPSTLADGAALSAAG